MPTDEAARLARYVKDRRLHLGLARQRAADLAGMSKDTWKRIEEGTGVRDMSYVKLDPVLQWAPGSARAVLHGGEPILVRPAEESGAEIAERPVEDLDERAREVVQLAMLATTSGLTADEIRALSDRAVKDLRDRGIIR